ncbi:MAG: hypothetical protein HN855_02335 [Anaerolineae bacterium]|jgi:uncharacterized membrane protein|nr:hypothetical protein [Anaerolineae bacterium]MBT7072230.1 hypothetical protein [Anaerolineae bacterium]MBT7323978.1 hypothetical protein [Anaerolineae bacterium]
MNDNLVPPIEEKKKPNTWLIVGIVAIVLCCCLVAFGALAWSFGDQVMNALGIY